MIDFLIYDSNGEFVPDGPLVCLPWEFHPDILNVDGYLDGRRLLNFNEKTHEQLSSLTHELIHYYHFLTTSFGLTYLKMLGHKRDIGWQIFWETAERHKNDFSELFMQGLIRKGEKHKLMDEWNNFDLFEKLLIGELPECSGNFYNPLIIFWWRELNENREWKEIEARIKNIEGLGTANPCRRPLRSEAPYINRKFMTGIDIIEGYARMVEFENRWIYGIDAKLRDFEFFLRKNIGQYIISNIEFMKYTGSIFNLSLKSPLKATPESYVLFLNNSVLAHELALMAPLHPTLVRTFKSMPTWTILDPVHRFYAIAEAMSDRRIQPITMEVRDSASMSEHLDDWCAALGWPSYKESLEILQQLHPNDHWTKFIHEKANPLINRKLTHGIDVVLDDLLYELSSMNPPIVMLTPTGCLGYPNLESLRDVMFQSLMNLLKAEIANFTMLGTEGLRLKRFTPVLRPLARELNMIWELIVREHPYLAKHSDLFIPKI